MTIFHRTVRALIVGAVIAAGWPLMGQAGTAGTAEQSRSVPLVPVALLTTTAGVQGIYTFRNAANNLCIDDSQVGPRGFACNGMNYQKWEMYRFNDGTYRMRNLSTNRCLQDTGGKAGSGGDTTLGVVACSSTQQNSWSMFSNANTWILQNQWTAKKMFTASNGVLGTTSLSSGNTVFWYRN